MSVDPRRNLPSVSGLLETTEVRDLLLSHPRGLVVDAIRQTLDDMRSASETTDSGRIMDGILDRVTRAAQPSLRPVINATGIVLHTNLGRAPLADAAIS